MLRNKCLASTPGSTHPGPLSPESWAAEPAASPWASCSWPSAGGQELTAYLDRLSQQVDGLRGEMTQRSDIQLMAEIVLDTRELFARHESDVERRLEEIKALIPRPYQHLDQRVAILQAKAERQDRDVLEVFREKFGTRQA